MTVNLTVALFARPKSQFTCRQLASVLLFVCMSQASTSNDLILQSHSTDPTERQAEALSSTENTSPPRQPNRVIMGSPDVSLTSHMPSVPSVRQDHCSQGRATETSVPTRPLAGETYDRSKVTITAASEVISVPGTSKLQDDDEDMKSSDQRVADATIAIEYCYPPQQSVADTYGRRLPTLNSGLLRPRQELPGRIQGECRAHRHSHLAASSYVDAVSPTTYSSEVVPPLRSDGVPLQPVGKWRCCSCQKKHDIYYFSEGEHPISILSCECAHRSCGKCMLRGQMKVFQPMAEPEVVQLSEDGLRRIRFGVFCDACGLSWRAVEVVDEADRKSLARHLSDMPKHFIKHANPLRKLRQHRSMADLPARPADDGPPRFQSSLNLRALSHEMEAEGHGKQAECATVHFTGIQCTCGFTTCSSSLCFQVVDPPKDVYEAEFEELMAERKEAAGFETTLDDQARGHQTPVLKLRGGGMHPNPLRSNPVMYVNASK